MAHRLEPWWHAALAAVAAVSCSDWPTELDPDKASGGVRVEDRSGNLGSSCGAAVVCASGLSCLTQLSGGLCTKNCIRDEDCGPSGACAVLASYDVVCLKRCTSDGVCRAGYECVSTGTASVCAEAVDGG